MSSKIPKMSIKIETKNRVINSFGSISILVAKQESK